MYRETFPSKIKKARENTGFSQYDVSRETGIHRSTITKYELGNLEPDLEKLGILADFYCVSVDWLLGTKGDNVTDYQKPIKPYKDNKKPVAKFKQKQGIQINFEGA